MTPRFLLLPLIFALGLFGCRLTADVGDGGGPDGMDGIEVAGMVTRIQTGEFYSGTNVEFEAVVTAVAHEDDANFDPIGIAGLVVSDRLVTAAPYSGIQVDFPSIEPLGSYEVGDLVVVLGNYGEYYGASIIAQPAVSKLGVTDVPIPLLITDPTTVATQFVGGSDTWAPTTDHGPLGPSLEGVLVEVQDVEITRSSLDHGMFEVTGGLAIDKELHYYQGMRTEGTDFVSITGILMYSFDAYKLAPRSDDDFVK